ncbi:MAG: hypothetical protein AAGA03_08575 [Planctomycetota bacterium]
MKTFDRKRVGSHLTVNQGTANQCTVIPIERVTMAHSTEPASYWCHATIRLQALVIRSSSGVQAFDLDAELDSLADLRSAIPEIERHLGSCRDD